MKNVGDDAGIVPYFNVSKKAPIYVVIPNQSSDWCGNPTVRRKICRFKGQDV